jgi:hypothetical protein
MRWGDLNEREIDRTFESRLFILFWMVHVPLELRVDHVWRGRRTPRVAWTIEC